MEIIESFPEKYLKLVKPKRQIALMVVTQWYEVDVGVGARDIGEGKGTKKGSGEGTKYIRKNFHEATVGKRQEIRLAT